MVPAYFRCIVYATQYTYTTTLFCVCLYVYENDCSQQPKRERFQTISTYHTHSRLKHIVCMYTLKCQIKCSKTGTDHTQTRKQYTNQVYWVYKIFFFLKKEEYVETKTAPESSFLQPTLMIELTCRQQQQQ